MTKIKTLSTENFDDGDTVRAGDFVCQKCNEVQTVEDGGMLKICNNCYSGDFKKKNDGNRNSIFDAETKNLFSKSATESLFSGKKK